MPTIEHTQSSQNRYPRRSQSPKAQHASRAVWPDNPAPQRARIATNQPASPKKDMRSRQLQTNIPRTQKRANPKRKTVQLALWIKPVVKAELQRIAEQEGLSMSSVGSAF